MGRRDGVVGLDGDISDGEACDGLEDVQGEGSASGARGAGTIGLAAGGAGSGRADARASGSDVKDPAGEVGDR